MATLTGQMIGRYKILDRVGQGGMATVYKAYDPVENREVAVKVLSTLAAESPHFTARFAREAKTVTGLRHPNIVPVWDYGEDEGKHFLVMPLLEVGSLSDRLMKEPLKPRESGRIVGQVCEALEYAHQSGVVHRDVKPSNILLDQDGNALVSDFGLVYVENASVSLTGSALIGTPAYMSPEQARGDKVTPATDQYAFGVVLYELATGQLPYDGETPMAVAIKHITHPIPFPREQNPNVPGAIENVILKATAKDPADRFESMAALGQAYQEALQFALDPKSFPMPKIDVPDSVIASHAAGPGGEQPEERRRRRPLLVPLALAILLLLLFLPARAFGLLGFLDGFSGSAEGTGLTVADLSGPQLTAMAGTLEVMSTQLAEAQGTRLSPEEMQTAVVGSFLGTQESGDSDRLRRGDAKVSPTPTIAGTPGPTATPGLSATAEPTWTSAPTLPGGASPTSFPSATSPGPSATSPPSTAVPPTAAAPTALNTPIPPTKTNTPNISPSSTSSPTWTSVPTATLPSPTAVVDVCSQFGLGGFQVAGQEVKIEVFNNSEVGVKIVGLHLDWPPPNAELKKVELGGDEIWKEGDHDPPTDIPAESDWKGSSNKRKIGAGGAKTLVFFFDSGAEAGPYSLHLEFDNGCVADGD